MRLLTFGQRRHVADDTLGVLAGDVEPFGSVGQVFVLDGEILGQDRTLQHSVSERTEETVVLVLVPVFVLAKEKAVKHYERDIPLFCAYLS